MGLVNGMGMYDFLTSWAAAFEEVLYKVAFWDCLTWWERFGKVDG